MFSDRLTQLRKEKGLSQKQLAEDLGVTQATIARYENGTRQPSLDFLVVIALYLGVSTDYLLGL